jgi:hypothetical protein
MAGFSTYQIDLIFTHLLRSGTWVKPAGLYISLHSAPPTKDTAVALANELALGFGGYSRAATTPHDNNFSVPITVGGIRRCSNAVNVAYGQPSADWNGGLIIAYAGMFDAPTGGNLLAEGVLSTPRLVQSADNSPTFGPGSLIFSLD